MRWLLHDRVFFTLASGWYTANNELNKKFYNRNIPCSGLHHEKKSCESDHVVAEVRNVLSAANKYNQTYPESLNLASSLGMDPDPFLPNGGWGDIRDHQLCLNFTAPIEPTLLKTSGVQI